MKYQSFDNVSNEEMDEYLLNHPDYDISIKIAHEIVKLMSELIDNSYYIDSKYFIKDAIDFSVNGWFYVAYARFVTLIKWTLNISNEDALQIISDIYKYGYEDMFIVKSINDCTKLSDLIIATLVP
jgi:hypothetical protein